MFSFYNRHYIFRQSNGEIRDFYCDSRHNLCSSTLDRKGMWSEATVLNRNVHQYFYAELDQDSTFHLLFQDNSGNINYSFIEGQAIRTIPVLNNKTPSVYNKQLYIAPLKGSVYLFYVLQHDNSFLLAYQLVSKNKVGTPKIVDYVSASNIPCTVLYDSSQSIYSFYQSYDGKYLQLGYKKFNTSQRHWSDFTPITKYNGNCEYPHGIIDTDGTIHLCYQRRGPKLFEMVYQQKSPDKNLWSTETVLHSSIHAFEKASILQAEDKIVVYWIRDNTIYYSVAPLSGESWSKPARYGSQLGHQFHCVCYKDQIETRGSNSSFSMNMGDVSLKGDVSSLSPGIYPGIVSNGFKLAFVNADSLVGGSPFPQFPPSGRVGVQPSGGEIQSMVLGAFKQVQDNIGEIRTGWIEAKKEMAKLTNAYIELTKEINKYSIRLNMLENKINQLNNPYRKIESMPSEICADNIKPDDLTNSEKPDRKGSTTEAIQENSSGPKQPSTSLDPAALKAWEEWQEPKEWSEAD